MTPERWQQMRDVLGEALELAPDQRPAFLLQRCGADPELQKEVSKLLAAGEKLETDFLESPGLADVTIQLAHSTTGSVLAAGTRLGPYAVQALLGAGGMGEVYRARDTRLGRAVAIKLIPPALSSEPERRQRFEREARAISSLNHPHICQLYDVGEQDGLNYLVMEYLEGETLAKRLQEAPLPLDLALRYATEVADALDTAHRRGIVHRDLKPGNIFITMHGESKVLDFGLAKLEKQTVDGETPTAAETTPEVLTTPGTAMGTVAYMSPEQARGEELDSRTDIFSLGAVLYEMVTGKMAFPGRTSAVVFKAILDETPKRPSEVSPTLPQRLDQIVEKALKKDRLLRYQHASELQADLLQLKRDIDSAQLRVAVVEKKKTKKLWKLIAVAGVFAILVVLGAAGFRIYSLLHRPVLTDRDTIVLSDFDNKTGDTVFDDTLKQGLSVQLEQSPFLALVSDRRVNEILTLMGRSPDAHLTANVTREVCQRARSKAMVSGSIAGLGRQYVIGLKAVNCETGDVLAEAQEQAAGKEAVLKALDAAAVNLRSKLGESLSSVQGYATPVEEATTPSLEALKAYSLGTKTYSTKGGAAALPFFKRAVDLDPNFAMPYCMISFVYWDLNEVGQAAESARRAYDLREKVSEQERFYIEGNYYFNATGELEKAAQAFEEWQRTYPRDPAPYRARGLVAIALGNLERASEEFREAMRMEPDSGFNYVCLGYAYMTLNRLDESEAVYEQAEERKLEHEYLLLNHYFVVFVKGNTAQMAQLVSAAMGKPGAEGMLLAAQADTEGWYGKLKDSHDLTQRAVESAQHNDEKESAALYQAEATLLEVESGNRLQARDGANAALKLAPSRDVRAIAALALARAGDTAEAEKLAAELDKTFALNTLVQRYWLPTIRAAVALERKDPNRAIELLKMTSPIELSEPTNLAMSMCPVYLRGEAYLMLHDGNRAATEFQKFIDHRGLVANFPWGALARLGLARAYALQSDTAKARTAYQHFLTIWKDADPDIPILKQAKADYAKLQ